MLKMEKKLSAFIVLFIIFIVFAIPAVFYFHKKHSDNLLKGQVIKLEKEKIKVYDGDIISYKGKIIRLLGYDAPELPGKKYGGKGQEPYASQAKKFLEEKIKNAEKIELYLLPEDFDREKFGMELGHLFIDEKSIALMMVENGLAYEYVSYYGHHGFKELAVKIYKAGKDRKLPFQHPAVFREKYRVYEK